MDAILSINFYVRQRQRIKTGLYRKAVTGKNFVDNVIFARNTICTAWCLAAHILLSNDVHPNPGPDSDSLSSTCTSNAQLSSLFTHNLSVLCN